MSDKIDIDNVQHLLAVELFPGLSYGNVFHPYSDSPEADSVELHDTIHPIETAAAETPPSFPYDAANPGPGPDFSSQPGFDEDLHLNDLDMDHGRGSPETDASVSSQNEDEVNVGSLTPGPSQVSESSHCDKTNQQTMRNDNDEMSLQEPTAGPSTCCSNRCITKAQRSATTTMDVDEDSSAVQKALLSNFAQLEGTVVASNCSSASSSGTFTMTKAFEDDSDVEEYLEWESVLSSASGSEVGDTATDLGKILSTHEPLKHAGREGSKRVQANSCSSSGPSGSEPKKRKVKNDMFVQLKMFPTKKFQKHKTDKQCHDTFNRRSATLLGTCAEMDGTTGSKSFLKTMNKSLRTGKIYYRTYGEDFYLPGGTSAEPGTGAGTHLAKTNRNRKPSTVTSNPNQNSDDGANAVNCTACHGNTQKVQLEVQTPGHAQESQDCQDINSEWVQCQAVGGCLNRIHVYCLGFPSQTNIPAGYQCRTCRRIRCAPNQGGQ